MQERGLSESQMLQGFQRLEHLRTPEGQAELATAIGNSSHGEAIYKQRLEKALSDREQRRNIRRLAAKRDAAGQPVEDADEDGDEAPPAWQAAVDAAMAAAKRAEEAAGKAGKGTAKALQLAVEISQIISSNPIASKNAEVWKAQVLSLVDSGDAEYQGANGVKKASDDVIAMWEHNANMVGRPERAPASPSAAGGAPLPKGEDMKKLVLEARRSKDYNKLSALVMGRG